MNIFTRSSIELISAGVNSGDSRPTTRCFLFFGFGFHARVESLYYYPKASLKYIRTIFRNLFYEDSVRQSSTSYKLSKNNKKLYNGYIIFCEYVKKNRLPLTPRPYGRGLMSAMELKNAGIFSCNSG